MDFLAKQIEITECGVRYEVFPFIEYKGPSLKVEINKSLHDNLDRSDIRNLLKSALVNSISVEIQDKLLERIMY